MDKLWSLCFDPENSARRARTGIHWSIVIPNNHIWLRKPHVTTNTFIMKNTNYFRKNSVWTLHLQTQLLVQKINLLNWKIWENIENIHIQETDTKSQYQIGFAIVRAFRNEDTIVDVHSLQNCLRVPITNDDSTLQPREDNVSDLEHFSMQCVMESSG